MIAQCESGGDWSINHRSDGLSAGGLHPVPEPVVARHARVPADARPRHLRRRSRRTPAPGRRRSGR
ncbi:hypothetical protein ACIQBJ_14240 [Kitasatospora sp. NPDC088391]|uniref:hypothetical protein n=1 Tax=Kitasatospora sp. NPDC088391 TaxID=3364074 RepID=UPI0037F3C4C1